MNPMKKLFEELLSSGYLPDDPGYWHPAADIYRCKNGWLVKFDLAGVRPTEVTIRCHGRDLSLCGTRRDAVVEQGLRSYSLEINYNRFERRVTLPSELDNHRVHTEYIDGMLLVWLTINE